MSTSPPAPPKHKLYVLSDGKLLAMAGNDRFIKEFPFIQGLKARTVRRTGCGSCRGHSQQDLGLLSSVKQAIVNMGGEKKRVLKRFLDASQIRLVYRRADGKTIQYTF